MYFVAILFKIYTMSNIIAGLFNQNVEYKVLEADLENAGFSSQDYLIYINDDNDRDHFMASVEVNNENAKNAVDEIFAQNDVTNSYEIENWNIQDAKNYDALREHINVISRTEIKEAAPVDIKSTGDGLDTEVKFGE